VVRNAFYGPQQTRPRSNVDGGFRVIRRFRQIAFSYFQISRFSSLMDTNNWTINLVLPTRNVPVPEAHSIDPEIEKADGNATQGQQARRDVGIHKRVQVVQ
jgi:hypothetical protein